MIKLSPSGSTKVTADYLRKNPLNTGLNVVILGAGASIQAFPQGDYRGMMQPSMDNLVQVVGLESHLRDLGVTQPHGNFELIYSRLYSDVGNRGSLEEIENKIRRYFGKMELPQHPTIYDHLLLSLRPNDLVATFNWDPFLYDSYQRLSDDYDCNSLPRIAFLHGNVRVGYCLVDKKLGRFDQICPHCSQRLKPSPLLFPIKDKDYESDPSIDNAWRKLRMSLQDAFTITVFGYSAPASDRVAFETMKKAWKHSSEREHETIFFIDTKSESDIKATWDQFLFSHHYKVRKDFYQSWIPRHARRAVEALMVPTIEGKFVEDIPIPRTADWPELQTWYSELLSHEKT